MKRGLEKSDGCFDARVSEILEQLQTACLEILAENLLGIYVHGSLAFGCFHWEISDIDVLLVTEQPPLQAEKEALLKELLAINELCPPKGLEMSLVLERYLEPFCYPTPFELHYSNAHQRSCEENLEEYCAHMNGTDKDLAAHIMVIRQVGITLYGRPIGEMFGKVPKEAYLDSLYYDIASAAEDVIKNPVYVICNLCRVLAYVTDRLVLSKAEGARWLQCQAARLGEELPFQEGLAFVKEAEESYRNSIPFQINGREEQLKEFAEKLSQACWRSS